MKKKRLISASALYKNNAPGGIGFTIENDANDDLNYNINVYIKNYKEAWDDADNGRREEFIKGYFKQLDYYSQFTVEQRNFEQNMDCMTNIWFLENYGFLKTDNFNGCNFLYEDI